MLRLLKPGGGIGKRGGAGLMGWDCHVFEENHIVYVFWIIFLRGIIATEKG